MSTEVAERRAGLWPAEPWPSPPYLPDPDQPREEERFLLVGESNNGRLLVLLHRQAGSHPNHQYSKG